MQLQWQYRKHHRILEQEQGLDETMSANPHADKRRRYQRTKSVVDKIELNRTRALKVNSETGSQTMLKEIMCPQF